MQGVQRRMLDRVGDEVARATSIVRYAPGSHFSPHVHSGGEEFMVLEGVFQDEHGDYPAGSYIRNPPQSRHTPGSEDGCVIFVKLWQFDPDDRTAVVARPQRLKYSGTPGNDGVEEAALFQDERERVTLAHWRAGASVEIDSTGGAEILVLAGTIEQGGDTLTRQSWLRIPTGTCLTAKSGPDGAHVWIKTGHIRFAETGP